MESLYFVLIYHISMITMVLTGKADDLSNYTCTNCDSTTYCRSHVLAKNFQEIQCYKHGMDLAEEHQGEGKYLLQMLKMCNYDLPLVQNTNRYIVYSGGYPCNISHVYRNGGHFQTDSDASNCLNGAFPYICKTTPGNMMTAQHEIHDHYFLIIKSEQNFSACLTTCQHILQANGIRYIPQPFLLLPENVKNGLDHKQSYWLAWIFLQNQCGMIGVPGKPFIQYPVVDCTQKAFCICESHINLTAQSGSKSPMTSVTVTDSSSSHGVVTTTSSSVSVNYSPIHSSSSVASSLRPTAATLSISTTISPSFTSYTTPSPSSTGHRSGTSYTHKSTQNQDVTPDSASSKARRVSNRLPFNAAHDNQPTDINTDRPISQTMTLPPQSSSPLYTSNVGPESEVTSFSTLLPTTVQPFLEPGSSIMSFAISPTSVKLSLATTSMTMGTLKLPQNDGWIRVNFTDKMFRLTPRAVGFCEARKKCTYIGGNITSLNKSNLTLLVWYLRLAPKAPVRIWIKSPGNCRYNKVPEKAGVVLIRKNQDPEFLEDYSSIKHFGLCERRNAILKPTIIPVVDLTSTITASPTTDWITQGKSEFFLNRNQSSFQAAENFCRRQLNASLLFYTSAMQYLDLSDDLGLSGQFWIGVMPSNISSSPKCLQLNVNHGHAKLTKVDCQAQSSSICSRCANISDVLNDPKFLKMLEELKIDKTATQKSQRKLKSVYEERRSATAVGSIGVGVLVTVFSLIALMDLSRLKNIFMQRTKVKAIHFKDTNDVKKRGRSMSECRC